MTYTMEMMNKQYDIFMAEERAKGVLWADIPSLTNWVLDRLEKAESKLTDAGCKENDNLALL